MWRIHVHALVDEAPSIAFAGSCCPGARSSSSSSMAMTWRLSALYVDVDRITQTSGTSRGVCHCRGSDTLLGFPMSTTARFIVVGLAGASTIGMQIVANPYTGQFYPMANRLTDSVGRWASAAAAVPGADRDKCSCEHEAVATTGLHSDLDTGRFRDDCRAADRLQPIGLSASWGHDHQRSPSR